MWPTFHVSFFQTYSIYFCVVFCSFNSSFYIQYKEKYIHNRTKSGMLVIKVKIKIKSCHLYIVDPLKHIINLIFQTGELPVQFKTSVITPIHKVGNKSEISNYRPISLINNFGKIFEKCLKTRLNDHLRRHNIIDNMQFGFREGMSTSDAMYKVVSQIKVALENNEKCLAIFLDLARAFDTVPHNELMCVLESYGIRGNVSNLFHNYLFDRIQLVKIQNQISDTLKIKMGVPQGTVIGPLLFIIYINSLLSLKIEGSAISYADDTVLIFSDKTWDNVKNKATRGVNIVKNWLDCNKLSLNIKKTSFMAFSIINNSRPSFNAISITDSSETIKQVEKVKYLGVIMDQYLKWDQHVLETAKKLRRFIYKFYQLRNILNTKQLNIVYKSLVESIINYGILVWGGLYDNALKNLNTVQNYILKVIGRKDKYHETKKLYSEQTLNARSLYFLTLCKFMYKNSTQYEKIKHQYDTRSKNEEKITTPFCQKHATYRYAAHLAPRIYNILPLEIKKCSKIGFFTKKCKHYIHNNYETLLALI